MRGRLHDRAQERDLDPLAARTTEQVANLGNHRRGNEDRAPGKVQTGEQVGTSSVVLVVAISCRNQRTGVANDHSGTPESLGEQVVAAAEVGTAAGERADPLGVEIRGPWSGCGRKDGIAEVAALRLL